jgi:hypothetical protein
MATSSSGFWVVRGVRPGPALVDFKSDDGATGTLAGPAPERSDLAAVRGIPDVDAGFFFHGNKSLFGEIRCRLKSRPALQMAQSNLTDLIFSKRLHA